MIAQPKAAQDTDDDDDDAQWKQMKRRKTKSRSEAIQSKMGKTLKP
jgi:hypothetical protein